MRTTFCLLALLLAFLPAAAEGQTLVPDDAPAQPTPGVKLIDESTGGRMRVVLHVWRPGVAIADVEVRVAVKPPTGPVVMVPVTPAVVTLPAGPSAVTILDMDAKTVAPGLYIVEARLLHPASGAMIARDMLAVVR